MKLCLALTPLVALLSAITAHAEPLPTTALPIEAIAQQPSITSVDLSPDGEHITAIIARPEYKYPVMSIWETQDVSKPPFLIPAWDSRPFAIRFLGDHHLLFQVDRPVGQNNFAQRWELSVVTDLKGSKFEHPFKLLVDYDDVPAIIQPGSFLDPNRYVIQSTSGHMGPDAVYALDVETLHIEKIKRGGGKFVGGTENEYLVADIRDGTLTVRENLRLADGDWQVYREIRNRQTDEWEEHPELGYAVKDRRVADPIGLYDADPNKLFVATNLKSDVVAIWVYDIVSRTWEPEPAFASAQTDIFSVSPDLDWSAKKVLGIRSYVARGAAPREAFVDDKWSAIQASLEARFPNQNVTFAEHDRKNQRAIVVVSGPKQPPLYYLLKNGSELSLLGKARPWIDPSKLGDTTLRAFAARDGLTIPAFVTLPPHYDKTKHGRIPLVVLPHGGPWARDNLDWDKTGWPQFLATRGYAVVQPQFRGSYGWGIAHWKAGDKEWGQRMQDDNDDAVAWLVADGVADPARTAILGYSYGGYAALVGAMRPATPYRCAIAGAAVSDLARTKLETGDTRFQRQLQGWTVEGFDPDDHVDDLKIPIMFFHGTNDTVVPIRYSRDFYRSVARAEKDVEYHEIKDMWHELPWHPEWHREILGYIEAYLAGPKCFGATK